VSSTTETGRAFVEPILHPPVHDHVDTCFACLAETIASHNGPHTEKSAPVMPTREGRATGSAATVHGD